MKVLQARLGQAVALGSLTPTQCLNAKDFAALDYTGGELAVTLKNGDRFLIMSANIALLKLEATGEESQKKAR